MTAVPPAGQSCASRARVPGGADLLTFGFGMTVAMWAVGYLGRMPGIMVPGSAIAAGLLAVLLIGGFLTGRSTRWSWPGGLVAGIITASLNLLIVLSLVQDDQTQHAPLSAWSIPGSIVGTALVTAFAAALGARFRNIPTELPNWTGRFAAVAVVGTLLLLMAGGLVTGREAGLAVPDWPQSYGYNMFLYPLARMTGNIYYEHTHRLYGALVGITTITLAIHLWRVDDRKWLRAVAVLAVVAVIAQGIMGGLRVALAETGNGIEVAQAEHETSISAILRVAHGVFGQVFFGLMVALTAFVSHTWRSARSMQAGGALADRAMNSGLVLLLLVQLLLGARVRHLDVDVMLHVAVAAPITLLALIAGMRAWGLYGMQFPVLKQLGITIMSLVGLQLGLGLGALLARTLSTPGNPSAIDAIVTTVHQVNGAALLACAVGMAVFSFRLLKPGLASDTAIAQTAQTGT